MTTPTISTLLLVPADGDPLGLLAPGAPVGDDSGAVGWVVPRGPIWQTEDPLWKPQSADAVGDGFAVWRPGFGITALTAWGVLLAYDGEPVPEGMDRAWRTLRKGSRFPIRGWGGAEQTADDIVRMGVGELLAAYLGTLIALDPAGRDVTDEVMRG